MPRIRFTADPKLPRDLAHLGYRNGDEVDLSENQADRWIRRGVAVVLPEELGNVAVAEVTAADPVEIPEDWADQHHMVRIALARRLTDATVETAVEADEVIGAEISRRAAPEHHQV